MYGSLRDPAVRVQVLGPRAASVTTCSAVLHGYARIMVPSFDYPFVVSAEDVLQADSEASHVDGELLLGLQPADYETLDRYEDVEDGLYVRVMVTVVKDTGPADAWVYLRGPNAPA